MGNKRQQHTHRPVDTTQNLLLGPIRVATQIPVWAFREISTLQCRLLQSLDGVAQAGRAALCATSFVPTGVPHARTRAVSFPSTHLSINTRGGCSHAHVLSRIASNPRRPGQPSPRKAASEAHGAGDAGVGAAEGGQRVRRGAGSEGAAGRAVRALPGATKG